MESLSTRKCISNAQMVGAILLLGLFLITTQIGTTQARTLAQEPGYFSDGIIKRNTWWSKKSLDSLNTRTIQHDGLQSSNTGSGKCAEALEVYDCYVQKCVQSFVTCAREANTEELFGACQVLHKLCASSCSSSNNFDDALSL